MCFFATKTATLCSMLWLEVFIIIIISRFIAIKNSMDLCNIKQLLLANLLCFIFHCIILYYSYATTYQRITLLSITRRPLVVPVTNISLLKFILISITRITVAVIYMTLNRCWFMYYIVFLHINIYIIGWYFFA